MEEDTLRILKQRYAKGEITKKQYTQMKEDLKDEPLESSESTKNNVGSGGGISKTAIVGVIIVVAIVFLAFLASLNNSSQQSVTSTQTSTLSPTTSIPSIPQYTVFALKNGTINNQPQTDFITYTYNCGWQGTTMQCTGNVQYVGPTNGELNTNGGDIYMYCESPQNKCLLKTDSQPLGTLNSTNNNKQYTLSCVFSNANLTNIDDINVYLEIPTQGFPIFELPFGC